MQMTTKFLITLSIMLSCSVPASAQTKSNLGKLCDGDTAEQTETLKRKCKRYKRKKRLLNKREQIDKDNHEGPIIQLDTPIGTPVISRDAVDNYDQNPARTGMVDDSNSIESHSTLRIMSASGHYLCAGALVKSDLVLTAASCFSTRERNRTTDLGAIDYENTAHRGGFTLGDHVPGQWYSMTYPTFSNERDARELPGYVKIGTAVSDDDRKYNIEKYSIPTKTDIMMLKLSEPVPRRVAKPASIVVSTWLEDSGGTIDDWFEDKHVYFAGWGENRTGRHMMRRKKSTRFTSVNQALSGDESTATFEWHPRAYMGDEDIGSPVYVMERGEFPKVVGIVTGNRRFTLTVFGGGGTKVRRRERTGSGRSDWRDISYDLPNISRWLRDVQKSHNCNSFDVPNLSVVFERNNWRLVRTVEGHRRGPGINFFNDHAGAYWVLGMLREYGVNEVCGTNPQSSNFKILLRDGETVSGPRPNESCRRIDPQRMKIEKFDHESAPEIRWRLTDSDGRNPLAAFADVSTPTGPSTTAALNDAHYMKSQLVNREVTHVCRMGSSGEAFWYFRK